MGVVIGVGIGIIAVFILARGGGGVGVASSLTVRPLPPTIGSYPPSQPNLSPSYDSSPYIATGVQSAAAFSSSMLAHGASSTAGALTAGLTAGIGAAAAIIGTLLAQHKARLQGATNENNAAQTMVPVVDSFIAKTLDAYHSGQVDAATAASGLAQFDTYLYAKLRSFVGAPGTSWDDNAGINGLCNKSCTVGCCFYFGDLGPPLSLIRYVLGDRTGRWGGGDPRLSGNTVTVPKVYPSKYSQFSRASYTVTV